MSAGNRQIVLVRNPSGEFDPDTFEIRHAPIPRPGKGEFLVRNLYLSLDPANRLWAAPFDSYVERVPLGQVMRGFTVSQVIESRHPKFKAGDLVQGMDGWQDYAVSNGVNYNQEGKIDTWNIRGIVKAGLPISSALSVLGTTGLSACVGMLSLGMPRRGQTVLVSGAAGAVGQIAGQLAKIRGCRTVGIAGGPQKCRLLRRVYGYDAAIDYKRGDLDAAIAKACPRGVDVYFDNVGGDTLNVALTHLAMAARVIICGAISQYTTAETQGIQGPSNYTYLLFRRARMEGFIVLDHYVKERARMEADLIRWIRRGRLHWRDEIVDGLENAPVAVNRLYRGANMGKLTVKIADPQELPRGPGRAAVAKRKATKKRLSRAGAGR
ncbi:MAG: NADP-dependent oxidoreductase [Gammaproteobacteria bacterium]|nr:NADP-dependent oxidoreductase [Gammaproteobacteria bacterium]